MSGFSSAQGISKVTKINRSGNTRLGDEDTEKE